MPISMETLEKRLEQKKAAIAKRAATTKKHAQRYIKKGQKPEWPNAERRWSCGDLENSTKELRYLIKEKCSILKLIEDAKKNAIVLPPALDTYRKELEANFIRDRLARRNELCKQWEEHYKPLVEQKMHDTFDKFVNGMYRTITHWNFKQGHYIKDDDFEKLPEQDKVEWNRYKIHENAYQWKQNTEADRNETDEHLEKRSAKDAKILVEDIYKRVFGFTGEVTNCDGLRIDLDNRGFNILNGVVEGVNGKCRVESISAGGYNIQCWHIRVLVHSLKV